MSVQYLDATPEQIKAFMGLPVDGPLKMLNLLKFKPVVNATGKSGEETYKEYLKAAEPFFVQVNARILFQGEANFSIIGPTEKEWDKVLIVEYASRQDFISMVTAEGYPAHIRKEALEDSRLIFCS